jgi:hypothetical protein
MVTWTWTRLSYPSGARSRLLLLRHSCLPVALRRRLVWQASQVLRRRPAPPPRAHCMNAAIAFAASRSSRSSSGAAEISKTPVIVGVVVGSLLGLFVLVLTAFLLVRRFRRQSAQSASQREAGWNRAPAWGAEKSAAMMAEPPRYIFPPPLLDECAR